MIENYRPRIADRVLQQRLASMGAVLIEGPKWCGKTTTAEQCAASVIKLQDPDRRMQYKAAIDTRPSILLQGADPRLIDEWQIFPVIWDAVRTEVDRRQKPGQFILTGSNSIDRSQIMHTGTGRITRMRMLPMSLYESGESNGAISLRELFDNPGVEIDGITSPLSVDGLIFAACRGGWPGTLDFTDREAQLFVPQTYVESVCAIDAISVDGVKRDPFTMMQVIRSYARNISTLAKKSKILADIKETTSCSERTLDDYLATLRQLFLIDDMPAWNPSIRSATAIRAGVKRQFCDPSIAVAAMSLSPARLVADLNTFGFIFETLCCRDLRAYSAAIGGKLEYYRDRYGLEADAVLHLADGRYALVEFKLGSGQIDDGAAHLNEIMELTLKTGGEVRPPDLRIVITGGELAWRRDDGVLVVPIGCLKD